jgi:hypothetical protein
VQNFIKKTIDNRAKKVYNVVRKKEREDKKMKNLQTVICYKLKEGCYKPYTSYNGTWEGTYLAYYSHKTVEEAQKEVDEINATKPEKLWNDQPINWEKVDHFFVKQQEPMEG